MKKVLFFLYIFFFISSLGYSQTKFIRDPKEIEEETRRIEEELKKDPKAYKEYLEQRKRIEEELKIIQLYQENKISLVEAKRRLKPLIEKGIDLKRERERLKDIDKMIEALYQEIERLKRIKKDPNYLIDYLIEQRINTYLYTFEEEDLYTFEEED